MGDDTMLMKRKKQSQGYVTKKKDVRQISKRDKVTNWRRDKKSKESKCNLRKKERESKMREEKNEMRK